MSKSNLSQLSYFFPWSLVIALLLAAAFATIGILIYRGALKGKEEEPVFKKAAPLFEKFQKFIARFGYSASDPLSQSFSHALRLMHDYIGGQRFRYQLPWIVTLGTSGSGKSTLLNNLDLDMPIGRPHFESEGEDKPLCDWLFFEHGTVLDLDGKIVLEAAQVASDEDNWNLFLNLLAQHRPKRPLDGVVLTIPATEISGKTSFSHDEIMIRAEYLYQKLWKMQHVTGIRVPIYIVITKCDVVPGFLSFCKSIPSHNRHDIFGWSNDHTLDALYDPEWIDTAFSSINSSLYRIQEEIYANSKTVDGRDGVFLFPITFNQLKAGIRTFTNHLFKATGYHESFFLRGIYFVGDSHLEKKTSENKSPLLRALGFSNENGTESRNIFFGDNLFENKIFREFALARPISRILLGNTTAMRIAKVAVSVAVIIGTLGLLRANDSLQKAKVNLVPALTQVEVVLEKTKKQSETSDIGRVYFDQQAQILLNTMTKISVSHLSSIFIPPSWFSNLDTRIKYVMGLAYDQVILSSMGRQLEYNASELFSLETIIPVQEPVEYGIDPLKTAEFYRLRNYIVEVRRLEYAANKYNQLGTTTNLRDVAEVIKYLFNYEMPESFFDSSAYYMDALKQRTERPFDFTSYQDSASIKLRKLYDAFQLVAFDPDKMVPGLGRLMTNINQFTGLSTYTAYDEEILYNIYQSLQETINSIEDPGLDWIDADHFDPGPAYEKVEELIIGSSFFPNAVALDLLSEVHKNFTYFRQLLAKYTSPFFDGHLFATEEGEAKSEPSQGALDLEKNLSQFFSQKFMEQREAKPFVTNIPLGSILLWDTLRLQQAVNLIKDYNNFLNTQLLSLPKELQPILQKVARQGLTKNLVYSLAESQIFSSAVPIGSKIAPEDALLSQVQNYRAASSYLEQILFALKANNANTAFSMLKGLLTKQVYTPLKKLDAILNSEGPYAIKQNSFDWWTGSNMAGLEAYGVSNLSELKNYLEIQRERINYLAREFAEPLVSFLEAINKEGFPESLPLLTKWEGILYTLEGYGKKAPGNGLIELEDYIMKPLNEVTLSTCNKYADFVSMISAKQDYFLSILINIEELLYKRCSSLSGYVSADNYMQLADFFNDRLAGKFPFTETVDDSSPDASPEDIRTFFEIMGTQAANIKATLNQATNLGPTGKNALLFIEQMEKVKVFFGDYLAPNSALPYPAFTFDITFRVNRERELRANEILHWKFTTGDTTITLRSPSHKGYWRTGSPVQIVFDWAQNSPLQPMAAEGNANYSVEGDNAIFAYNGTWAFLRLLRQHKASPSNFDSLKDETPITLKFDIPLTSTISSLNASSLCTPPQASVFVQFEVSPAKPSAKPAATSKASSSSQKKKISMGKKVTLPYFPFCAPTLKTPRN